MNKKNSEFEVEKVRSEINSGNYENALQIIKTEGTRGILVQGSDKFFGDLFSFATTVLTGVISSHTVAATEILTKAIVGEIQKQARELDSMDKAYELFMEQAKIIVSNTDISDKVAVENARNLLESIRVAYEKMIEKSRGQGILDKIVGWFRF